MSDKLRGGSTVAGGLIWHSGNDGAGSGLDADLLDGQQGSYYVNTGNVSATEQATAANALTTTASRSYAIQFDSSDNLVVNVPWVDTNTTYSVASNTVAGLVKIGYSENGKNYPVELSSDQMYVNVPWTDTVYSLPEATATTRGGIELFSDTDQIVAANAVSATAGRTYGIQLNADGQAVVNVPWSDTNTTNFNIQANGGTQVNISAGEEVNFINGTYTTAAVVNQANPTVTFNHNSTTRGDSTSAASPAHGGTFTAVDSVTTNTQGHVTAINVKTVTLPSDNNTDTLQSIANDTADADRYITFVASATGAQTGLSNASLRYNPTKKVLTLPDFGLISATATTTSTTQTAILSFSATTYAGAKIVVNATTGVNRHICELLVAHDGTTATATQYGSVTTASDLGTYDVDISGGNVRLLATSASATSTVYKVSGTLMEA